MEVLSDLKSALDETRHSVWALLGALAGYSGFTVEEVLQNYRMQRASELLHVLRHQVESATVPQTETARSFLEENPDHDRVSLPPVYRAGKNLVASRCCRS